MRSHHRIASLHVELSERNQLKQWIESMPASADWRWSWSDDGDADALIIDVDSVTGHVEWLRARAAGFVTLPLSNQGNSASETVLMRPVTRQSLERALRAASRQLKAAAGIGPAAVGDAANDASIAATAPQASLAPPAAADSLELIDFLTIAVPSGAVRLMRPGLPSLTLDPDSGGWFGPNALRALAPYCETPIGRHEWQRVSPAVLGGLRESGAMQPLSRLIWFATLCASRGRLLSTLDPSATFRLVRWPRLEREFPRHFRIANALLKQPGTIAEIAAASGLPAPEVIGFLNAFAMVGSIAQDGGAPGATAAAATDAPPLAARVA